MYIDPGFGGMFLQIIVAIAAVSGAVLYGLRRKIASLFTRGNSKSKNIKTDDNPEGISYTRIPEDGVIDMLDGGNAN